MLPNEQTQTDSVCLGHHSAPGLKTIKQSCYGRWDGRFILAKIHLSFEGVIFLIQGFTGALRRMKTLSKNNVLTARNPTSNLEEKWTSVFLHKRTILVFSTWSLWISSGYCHVINTLTERGLPGFQYSLTWNKMLHKLSMSYKSSHSGELNENIREMNPRL